MTKRYGFALCAGLAILPLARVHAQDSRALKDRTVPLELVEALLSTPRSPLPPTITVGELPPPMQGSVFVPPGARILGGSFSSLGASVIMQASMEPGALERLLRAEHMKLGWKELNMPGAGGIGGGFRDASGAGGGVLCKGGTALNVQITLLRAGESRIRMSSDADGICSMMDRSANAAMNSGDPFAGIKWPILVNPASARGFGACPTTRFMGGMQSTELMTPTPLAELMNHYGKQLADSGWTKAAGETVSQAFTKQDATTGTKLQLRLVGSTYDGFPVCRRMSIETGVVR